MKLIKPKYAIFEQIPTKEGAYKQIERVGRTCYKSEDKMTDTSATGFVERMIKSNHGAMLEHGTLYLKIQLGNVNDDETYIQKASLVDLFKANPFSFVNNDRFIYYITTNLRVIVENNLNVDEYICEPTEYHEKRYTVKFTIDRGVSHEFVRHRTMSFAQESTRYCNYSKSKFGEITYILPVWLQDNEILNKYIVADGHFAATEFYNADNIPMNIAAMINSFMISAAAYKGLCEDGWTAQQARIVLPTALKTELCMTGTAKQWLEFFKLRAIGTTGAPHPQAKEVALPLYKEFIRRKYIEEWKEEQ